MLGANIRGLFILAVLVVACGLLSLPAVAQDENLCLKLAPETYPVTLSMSLDKDTITGGSGETVAASLTSRPSYPRAICYPTSLGQSSPGGLVNLDFTNFDWINHPTVRISAPREVAQETSVTVTFGLIDFAGNKVSASATLMIEPKPSQPNQTGRFHIGATDFTAQSLFPGLQPSIAMLDVPPNAPGTLISAPLQLLLGQETGLVYATNEPEVGGGIVPVRATIESQVPNDLGNQSDIFANPTHLFPNNVLIQLKANFPLVLPVHSGTAILLIEPTLPGQLLFPDAQPVRVQVTVPTCPYAGPPSTPAVRLGNTRNKFDDDILCAADFRGIPPQFIKAHIDQESLPGGEFKPQSYRYEPLSVDFKSVSFGDDLRTDDRFSPYALATFPDDVDDAALLQGAKLQEDDIQPREKYSIQLDPNTPSRTVLRAVRDGTNSPEQDKIDSKDQLVTMENIFWTNDKHHVKENWGSNSPNRLLQFRKYQKDGDSPFVGQTVIAASYGLLQVLYITAVDELDYKSHGIGRPPTGLFDVKTSLDLATEKVAKRFKELFPDLAVTPGITFTPETFFPSFGNALDTYNSAFDYPVKVLARVPNFPPIKQEQGVN